MMVTSCGHKLCRDGGADDDDDDDDRQCFNTMLRGSAYLRLCYASYAMLC